MNFYKERKCFTQILPMLQIFLWEIFSNNKIQGCFTIGFLAQFLGQMKAEQMLKLSCSGLWNRTNSNHMALIFLRWLPLRGGTHPLGHFFSCSRTTNLCKISHVSFKFLALHVPHDASAAGTWSNSKYTSLIDFAYIINEYLSSQISSGRTN